MKDNCLAHTNRDDIGHNTLKTNRPQFYFEHMNDTAIMCLRCL